MLRAYVGECDGSDRGDRDDVDMGVLMLTT